MDSVRCDDQVSSVSAAILERDVCFNWIARHHLASEVQCSWRSGSIRGRCGCPQCIMKVHSVAHLPGLLMVSFSLADQGKGRLKGVRTHLYSFSVSRTSI